MSAENFSSAGAMPADHIAQDAEDTAAALLLNEVQSFLRDGQPRHAIAHIVEVTGVDRDMAENFVVELQGGVFRQSA